jgi:N-acetylmuramoyl-L-alanine amidase
LSVCRSAVLVLAAASFAAVLGCQAPSTRVIDPLPPPIHDFPGAEPPAPAVVPAPAPPPGEPAAPDPHAVWLPPNGISKRWTTIVIHHTATDFGSAATIDRWHRDKGWDGLGYHFVIGNGTETPDGAVEVGFRWREQVHGAHCRLSEADARRQGLRDTNHYNEHGIGIVLVGNFQHSRPTERQMASLVELVSFLMKRCGVPASRVVGHGEVDQTKCPGRNFDVSALRRRLGP